MSGQRVVPGPLTATEYHRRILAPVGEVVIGMERQGCPVDMDALRSIETRMAARSVELRLELARWCPRDINWNSWQQLAAWLHNSPEDDPPGLGLEESPYCKKGEVADDKVSTDDRALEWIAGHNAEHREPINALRMLRQCERMGRYARDWIAATVLHPDGTWRLHPTFGMASDYDTRPGAVTGRFGVKNPPLNQVPRNPKKDPAGMRSAFIAPPGNRLVVVDYSQLEVVILAHLIATLFGDDDPLVKRVRAGEDIHGPTARVIFGELAGDPEVANAPIADFKTVPKLALLRDLAKAGLYGENYGKGEQGFATSVFLPNGEPLGRERARLLKQGLAQANPGVPRYQRFIRDWITRHAFIMSLFGRWQPLPNAKSPKQGWRNRAWRQALNYGMQAGGQEILALALILIANDPELRDLGYVLSLVVHDEIVGWAPEGNADRVLALVKQHMCSAVQLLCPLKAAGHHGRTWAEAK